MDFLYLLGNCIVIYSLSFPEIFLGFLYLVRGIELKKCISRYEFQFFFIFSMLAIFLFLWITILADVQFVRPFTRTYVPFKLIKTLSVFFVSEILLRHTKGTFSKATDRLYCHTLFTSTNALLLYIAVEPITPRINLILSEELTVVISTYAIIKIVLLLLWLTSSYCLVLLIKARNDSDDIKNRVAECTVRTIHSTDILIFINVFYFCCMILVAPFTRF